MKRMACSWMCCIMLCFAFTSGFAQQQKSAFRLIPQVMYTGDTIRIVYDPVLAGYGDSLPVKAYMYRYKNFQWKGYDFPMQRTDTGWVATHVLEDSVPMLAWRFHVGDSIDNGKQFPNLTMIHDRKTGKMMSGSYTEYALVRRRNEQGKMSPIANPLSLVDNRVLQLWLPKEWEDMYVRRNRFTDVAAGLRLAFGERVDSVLRAGAKEITALPDVTEKEMLYVKSAYEKVLNDQRAADSMKQIILAKYPDGLAYRLNLIWNLYLSRTDSARTANWKDFHQRFPADKYPYADYIAPNSGDPRFFTSVLQNQANMYFKLHQWKELNQLLSDCPFWLLGYAYEHYIDYALRLDEPPLSIKELVTLAGSIIDTMQTRIQSPDEFRSGRGLYASSEWQSVAMREHAGIFAYHAKLLTKEGRFKDAMHYAEIAKPYIRANDATFNSTYFTLLMKNGREAEALPFIQKAIYAGAFSADMMDVLKKDYVRKNKSDKGFADYVTSLKSKALIEHEHDLIRKAMVDLPATMFKLKNTRGEDVELAKQKGKIVVIDFWATWCYYCKLAMPGMQMAVDKYAKDKNVEFYFIATMEQDPNFKRMIQDFIKSKKYTFHVLYDNNGTSGKMDEAYAGFASTLKTMGIPLKVIIDQDGKIRWAGTGGSDNHIALADEVSYVIELLKKEKG